MFDWDDANLDHIARHGVEPEEAEEALVDPRRLGAPAYNVGGETRFAVLGATDAGRTLVVIFVRHGGTVRVITARDANVTEKRRYRRR